MKDIQNIHDIDTLVKTFYSRLLKDELLGPVFLKTDSFSLEKHIPIINQFWYSVIFSESTYKGNPMLVHLELNKRLPINDLHFKQWLSFWNATVDELFEGPFALKAKEKAMSIGQLMQLKINQQRKWGIE